MDFFTAGLLRAFNLLRCSITPPRWAGYGLCPDIWPKDGPTLFASMVISGFCDRSDLNPVVWDQQVYPKKLSFQALSQLVEDIFPNIISNKKS